MAEYGPVIHRVTRRNSDLPVNLILHQRLEVLPAPFHVLSWRTNWPSGRGSNRRWYFVRDYGVWTIPVDLARDMLDEAQGLGMLAEVLDDPYLRWGAGSSSTVIDSRQLSHDQRLREFASVTRERREPDWGPKPIFDIVEEPAGTWRKLMIVDTNREFVTFRSTTTERDYPMAVHDGMDHPWYMDNAMQDANPQQMRVFRQVLQEL